MITCRYHDYAKSLTSRHNWEALSYCAACVARRPGFLRRFGRRVLQDGRRRSRRYSYKLKPCRRVSPPRTVSVRIERVINDALIAVVTNTGTIQSVAGGAA